MDLPVPRSLLPHFFRTGLCTLPHPFPFACSLPTKLLKWVSLCICGLFRRSKCNSPHPAMGHRQGAHARTLSRGQWPPWLLSTMLSLPHILSENVILFLLGTSTCDFYLCKVVNKHLPHCLWLWMALTLFPPGSGSVSVSWWSSENAVRRANESVLLQFPSNNPCFLLDTNILNTPCKSVLNIIFSPLRTFLWVTFHLKHLVHSLAWAELLS